MNRLMATESYNWFVEIFSKWLIVNDSNDRHWPGVVAPPYGLASVKTTAAMRSGSRANIELFVRTNCLFLYH